MTINRKNGLNRFNLPIPEHVPPHDTPENAKDAQRPDPASYLEELVTQLEALGINDPYIEQLLSEVNNARQRTSHGMARTPSGCQ